MPEILKILLIAMILLFTFGCEPGNNDKTIGVWKLSSIEDNKIANMPGYLSYVRSDKMKDFVKKYYGYSFINFYSDTGCIMRNGDQFIHANWKINEKGNTINAKSKSDSHKKSNKEVIIKLIADTVLVILFKPDSNIVSFYKKFQEVDDGFSTYINYTEFVFIFKRDRFKYDEENDNIHSFSNNSWRIKPNKPETKEQIKKRLKESINNTKIFINDAYIREDWRYNTIALTAPVKIYRNGIGMSEKDEILPGWIDAFYNKEQAMQAYQMLDLAFRQNLRISKKENWVLTDIDLLNQLCEKLQ